MSIPFSSWMEGKYMRIIKQVWSHVDKQKNKIQWFRCMNEWLRNKLEEYIWGLLICWDDWKLVAIYIEITKE
jgi:hypothetical protein